MQTPTMCDQKEDVQQCEKRLFVGGLFEGATAEDLRHRFEKFGKIDQINLVEKKDAEGKVFNTFAYVNIESDEKQIKKCINAYNKTKWKGKELQIQQAKESFLTKLKQEREMQTDSTVAIKELPAPMRNIIRGAAPGTEVPDKKNWVVGKYGQVVPIVYIRNKDKKKIMKYDPSKYTHGYKKMDTDKNPMDAVPDKPIADLTWKMEDKETENSKKRKGIFPAYSPAKKKSLSKAAQAYKAILDAPDDLEIAPRKTNGNIAAAAAAVSRPRLSTVDNEKNATKKDKESSEDTDDMVLRSRKENATKLLTKKARTQLSRCASSSSSDDEPQVNAVVKAKKSGLSRAKKAKKVNANAVSFVEDTRSSDTDAVVSHSKQGKQNGGGTSQNGLAKSSDESLSESEEEEESESEEEEEMDEEEREEEEEEESESEEEEEMDEEEGEEEEEEESDISEMDSEESSEINDMKYSLVEERKSKSKPAGNVKDQSDSESEVSDDDDDVVNDDDDDVNDDDDDVNDDDDDVNDDDDDVNDDDDDDNDVNDDDVNDDDDSDDDDSDDESEPERDAIDDILLQMKIAKREKDRLDEQNTIPETDKTTELACSEEDENSNSVSEEKEDSASVSEENENSASESEEKENSASVNEEKENSASESEEKENSASESEEKENSASESDEIDSEVKEDENEKTFSDKPDTKKSKQKINITDTKEQMNDSNDRDSSADYTNSKPRPVQSKSDRLSSAAQMPTQKSSEQEDRSKSLTGRTAPVVGSEDEEEDIFDMIASGNIHRFLASTNSKHTAASKTHAAATGSATKAIDLSRFNSSSESEEENTPQPKQLKPVEKVKPKETSAKPATESSNKTTLETLATKQQSTKAEPKSKTSEDDKTTSETAEGAAVAKKKLSKSEKKKLAKEKVDVGDAKKAKHEKSEQQRLESFKQRAQEAQSQKNLIQLALADVDKVPANKKIVFASESSSSDAEEAEDMDTQDSDEQKGSTGPKLFDSDSGSGEEEAMEQDEFRIRPEYEGKKGQKLMKLQERVAGRDARFKPDQRFVDTSSSEDEHDAVSGELTEQQQEKQKALDVLKEIVGERSVLASRPVKMIKDINALQYDPEKDSAAQVEEPAKSKKKLKQEKEARKEEALPEVSKDTFFKVEGNLKEEFSKESASAGFSFLSMFGAAPADDTQQSEPSSTNAALWQQPTQRFSDESSDEEEEGTEGKKRKDGAVVDKSQDKAEKTVASSSSLFVFALDDPVMQEGIKGFCHMEDFTREEWLEKRPGYMESFRTKKKRMLRKQRDMEKNKPRKSTPYKRKR